ncbi:MAG: hypothetical protein DRO73_07155 [Candidatus Thorarchaeota archaeon]|nr:MAG: hypothetical protein DRO73_07155 [Candidatus Thorarchaeota archaeon]RLI59930.1 MAG: hypothetical protein DRO93_07790 [Candidatus Thorarchaeota archaeon]
MSTQQPKDEKDLDDTRYGDEIHAAVAAVRGDSQVSEEKVSEALVSIFSWRNYSVYLLTAWVFTGFSIMNSFFNLYMRAVGWDYAALGVVVAISSSLSAVFRVVGGYVGDTMNRKTLSVVAMLCMAGYFLLIGLFTEPIMIVLALLSYATTDIAKSGSSAYILDNTPREHSGLALSLFHAGRVFGVVTLVAFNLMVPVFGFPVSFRLMSIVAGISLVICSAVRTVYLEPSRVESRPREVAVWRDFVSEMWHAIKTLARVLPGALAIIMIDAFSDALFNFGALIYANESLGVSITGIGIMLAVTLIISVPLLLKIGRMTDRFGVKRTALIVYSMMPVCTGLLFVAPHFPLWASESVMLQAESIIDGLGAVFTTAFIAIVLKRINDALWWLIVTTMIQKKLPHADSAKFLAMFWFIIYVFSSAGPFVAGLIFTYFSQPTLFAVIFVLNIIILLSIGMNGLVNEDAVRENATNAHVSAP